MDLEEFARLFFADRKAGQSIPTNSGAAAQPVHVFYGGAHLFGPKTPSKLRRLAIASLESYAPDLNTFSEAFWLTGADQMPYSKRSAEELESSFEEDPESGASKDPEAFFAFKVHAKTIEKLKKNPIEDFRIDFEDGYGIRPDGEEDSHAAAAAVALAEILGNGPDDPTALRLPNFGIRIKSLQIETRERAVRTLSLFLERLLECTKGKVPPGFVITLPKIRSVYEVEALCAIIERFERSKGIGKGSIGIELMVETPEAVLNCRELVEASEGRCNSAQFGAYDFTAALGISSDHQHLRHDACVFARNLMLTSLYPLGIPVADSVTIEMPVAVHTGDSITVSQRNENRRAVHKAWRIHFNNIRHSMISGFYQSWDLHPAQLVARYAAIYAFYLESEAVQMARLKGFVEAAARANLTGTTFDDTASAQGILNFFLRGIRCGAFDLSVVAGKCGLREEEIVKGSFTEIMQRRAANSA